MAEILANPKIFVYRDLVQPLVRDAARAQTAGQLIIIFHTTRVYPDSHPIGGESAGTV